MQELTEAEKYQLAREIAADKHVDGSGYYNLQARDVFLSGCDAAMDYKAERISNEGEAVNEKDKSA